MNSLSRRHFGKVLASAAVFSGCTRFGKTSSPTTIASFQSDVTVPMGHPLMGGGIAPANEIITPLTARGFVLQGSFAPVVFVSIDWCEIRNGSYRKWQSSLAKAAGTDPERVMITSVHVHDAPVADREAEALLQAVKAQGSVCDIPFEDQAIARTVAELEKALSNSTPVTHIGTGRAQVLQIASNRRFKRRNGEISFNRTSATTDPEAAAGEEGTIDPNLQILSFWQQDQPLMAISSYATHPMSKYGQGKVSWDFVGDARELMEKTVPGVVQIYASGCSGNVTAGKYNDGSPQRRAELAARLHDGMVRAWKNTKRMPVERCTFLTTDLYLPLREDGQFSRSELEKRLQSGPKPFDQCLAALGLSWANRVKSGVPIKVQALHLGNACLALAPAEAYVEFQLFTQETRNEIPVLCCGYGECGPGYIPIEQAWKEGDGNLGEWCWVGPGSEERLKEALAKVLARPEGGDKKSYMAESLAR